MKKNSTITLMYPPGEDLILASWYDVLRRRPINFSPPPPATNPAFSSLGSNKHQPTNTSQIFAEIHPIHHDFSRLINSCCSRKPLG